MDDKTTPVSRSEFKRWVRNALIGFLILFCGSLGAYAVALNVSDSARQGIVNSGNNVAVSGCNRDFKFAAQLRNLIIRGQTATQAQAKAGLLRPEQAKQAQEFYAQALEDLALPDCRQVAHAVTDDPSTDRRVVPLHP